MTNPFAPLMVIMIPIAMYFGLMSGLNSIDSDKKPNDIEFSFKSFVILLIVYHSTKFCSFNLFRTLVIDDGSTTSDQNPLFYMYY